MSHQLAWWSLSRWIGGIPWIDFIPPEKEEWDQVHFLQKQTSSNGKQMIVSLFLKIRQISRASGLHL
jgi:hypothetical protein